MEELPGKRVILKQSSDGKTLECRQKNLVVSLSGLPTVFQLFHLPDGLFVIALVDENEHFLPSQKSQSSWYSYFAGKTTTSEPSSPIASSTSTLVRSQLLSQSLTQANLQDILQLLHGRYVLCFSPGNPLFKLFTVLEECKLLLVFHHS